MKSTIIPILGTNYQGFVESRPLMIVGTTIATLRKTLKVMEAPRGADGAVAILVTRAAAGTLSSAAAVPTADFFVYIDDDASDENGTTILLPGVDAQLTAQFTIPAADGVTTADITVDSNKRVAVGDTVYITGIGYFEVTVVTSTTTITVVNNGATGNTGAGGTAAIGAWVTIVPATGPRAGRWMQLSAIT